MRGGLRIYVQGRSLAFSKDVVCRLRLTEVQSIDENKIVVDDPYGKVKGKADGFEHRQKCNSGGYEKNNKTSEGAVGNNNEWYWNDIENVTIKYVESYERD